MDDKLKQKMTTQIVGQLNVISSEEEKEHSPPPKMVNGTDSMTRPLMDTAPGKKAKKKGSFWDNLLRCISGSDTKDEKYEKSPDFKCNPQSGSSTI